MRNLIGLIILLLCITLGAQNNILWQENGVPVALNHQITFDKSILVNDDGTVLMFWTETTTGNRDLHCMLLSESGEDMWDEPLLVHDDEKPLDRARVSRSSDGNLLIACTRYEDNDFRSVWMRKFDTNLNALWDESIVLPTTRDTMVFVSPVPDADGGAYFFWADEWDVTNYVNHYDSDGEPVWEPQTLELNFKITTQPISDGEGGVIVPLLSPAEGNYSCSGLSRVLPDGTMPWGDEGFIRLGAVSPRKLLSYADNEYATLCWKRTGDVDTIRVYRTDLAGEQVCDPLNTETSVEFPYLFDMVTDPGGNLYITWFSEEDDECGYRVQKITPDNQLAWGDGTFHEAHHSDNQEVILGIDQQGNLYQSINRLSSIGIELLKYDSEGSMVWEQEILYSDGFFNYMFHGATMNVSDDAVTIYWCDNRTYHHSLYLQTVDSNGDIQWDEGGKLVREGHDSSIDYDNFHVSMNRNTPINSLFLSWCNSIGYSLYLQTIDLDGETGIGENGMQVCAYDNYGVLNHAMVDIDGQCLLVWHSYTSEVTNFYANLFDYQGNRLWDNDAMIPNSTDEWNCYPYESNIQSSLFHDGVLIGWKTWDSHLQHGPVFCMKIADGSAAWSEPVPVFEGNSERLANIVGDFVIGYANGFLYVRRLNSDGSFCEGWEDQELTIAGTGFVSLLDLIETPQGLGILYQDSYNDNLQVCFQIVHEDGSLHWDEGFPIDNLDRSNQTRIEMMNNDFCAFYPSSDTLRATGFNLDGEILWSKSLAYVDYPTVATASTPDGILVAYDPDYRSYSYNGYLQHVDHEGNTWNEPIVFCNRQARKMNLQVSQSPDSKYFISWMDNRNQGYLPYVQCFHYDTQTIEPVDVPAFSPSLSNYPNPFNPTTTIYYSIPRKGKVEIEVFNIRGQKVTTLVNESKEAGSHSAIWDGRDSSDKPCSSGIYFYRLQIGSHTQTRKMLLLQ